MTVMAKSLHDFVTEALAEVREIDPDDLADYQDYVLLDVREADEFEAGHIPGAKHVPRGFLEVKADLTHAKRDVALADRSQKFVCYCGGGHRSVLAARTLQEMGFTDAVSLRGGWTAWESKNR